MFFLLTCCGSLVETGFVTTLCRLVSRTHRHMLWVFECRDVQNLEISAEAITFYTCLTLALRFFGISVCYLHCLSVIILSPTSLLLHWKLELNLLD